MEPLLDYLPIAMPLLVFVSAFFGVDRFLQVTAVCVLSLAVGSISYGLGYHSYSAFEFSILNVGLIFAAGVVGLPIAKAREQQG